MRFAEIVKLLASPATTQVAFLGELPENAASPNFDIENNVHKMVILYLGSTTIHEGDGGTEGEENWRDRTQIQRGIKFPPVWLGTALQMLVDLKKPFLYTQHGLRSAHEWKLIRHLASEFCAAMNWPIE